MTTSDIDIIAIVMARGGSKTLAGEKYGRSLRETAHMLLH